MLPTTEAALKMMKETDRNVFLLKDCAYNNLLNTLKDSTECLYPDDITVQSVKEKVDLAVDIYLKASKQLQMLSKDPQPMF